ncbi:ribosome biogenesis regulatory protein-domain-containing protein [Naematelia encephala]|uniref:Ribosome biogenesis regulatory protein n=1 Tax=Naematelia encephala TaxID=71784 RepID=A0A1Y2AXN1_9TREE|nr:ribosome biogenesis regulatory protein-domain-containing protein [Naematelia encephala]
MDVSQELADYAAKHTTQVLERSQPVQVDMGLLAAFDNTPIDPSEYSSDLDAHLLQLTLTSTQALISALFALPTTPSAEHGPVIRPPVPSTILPREKPLPKPKEPTKWERFAQAKGISHKKRDKKEWDEERQEWVARWGRDGKNKQKEEEWATPVKAGMEADQDPAATARAERKARTAKNEKQHRSNLAQAAASSSASSRRTAQQARAADLERSMLVSKSATASMGKFDKSIEGEPKSRGVKRKFDENVPKAGWKGEKEGLLGVLKSVESGLGRKEKRKGETKEGEVVVRKAVRYHDREERLKAGRGGAGGGRGRGGARGRGRK